MNNRLISFLLVPLAGLFLLFHHAAYQTLLSQGDHGRDLYAFVQTLHGQMPYRDYWWVYGPIMPYYYALFLKIFGIAIPSVLIGKIVLTVLSGVFIFLSLSLFIPTLFAFMAAMWFWMYQPDFFFTYNHIGGIFCLTGITFALFSYIKQPRTKFLYFGLFFILLLAMVKVNFGITALFVFIIFYRLYDRFYKIPVTDGKKTLGQIAVIGVPLLILMTYFLLLFLLPVYEIRQCMPYMSSDQPYHSTPLRALGSLASAIITTPLTSPANFVFAIFSIGAIIASLIKILSRKTDSKERKQTLTAFMLLGFFYFINLHEYIVSGVLYRSFWATPFSTMMLFFVIGYSLTKISPKLQRLVFGSFFVLVFTHYVSQIDTVRIKKIPEQFLTIDRGHITTGNSEEWFTTVENTTNFIQTHIPKEESFFALPYDPIYYYLTNKTSPTRQLIFFNHINIPPQQETTIIAELERKDVKFILMSNRAFASQEPGLGFFGQSYCPLLGKYIAEHFEPIAQFGDWQNEPGWAWNHGTKIFKRVR